MRKIVQAVIVVALIAFVAVGTKVLPIDGDSAPGPSAFDPATFGATQFPKIEDFVSAHAVEAKELADAIAADLADAAEKYATTGPSGPVYSVEITGVVGQADAGIAPIAVTGLSPDLQIRVQFGPAVNGTDLRDVAGDIEFGQFRNQIEYQNAAAAINDELKAKTLSSIDVSSLSGKTVTVVGAFTFVSPTAWFVTPVEVQTE
ncbi:MULTISPECIES: DUF2291 family protein [unclassified Microbacterium]|uniref:DUF2291 family protein n=1 Tax=unclassified Microbacterium TaxID=2609290 RepID=UPI00160556B9|nr:MULTISPECIES: DUF2291 family protein [unclassified Microbacterium]QNA93378.1 DUF2291 domain-containing protein [Microbacterium sp. Se63.02b]QYM63605.1 DUF2291 domain-containing protein [Microbacterium sp. Se5.02b]